MEFGWVSEGNYNNKAIGIGNSESRELFEKVIEIFKIAGNKVAVEKGKKNYQRLLRIDDKLCYLYSHLGNSKEWQPYYSTIGNLNEDYGYDWNLVGVYFKSEDSDEVEFYLLNAVEFMAKANRLEEGESVEGFSKQGTRNYYRVNYKAMNQVDVKLQGMESKSKDE